MWLYTTKFWPTVQEEMTLTASRNNTERSSVPFSLPSSFLMALDEGVMVGSKAAILSYEAEALC